MDASTITAYINLLPEYTQYMDLFGLVTTNDEDCKHHLEILQSWRQLRYPGGVRFFEFINSRPKRPTRSASLGPSSLKLRTRAVFTYKHLVDEAESSGLPVLRRAAWVKLLDYLVICYIHLDDASMYDRIPDHETLLRVAFDDVSKERHTQWALPPGTPTHPITQLIHPEDPKCILLNEHPDGLVAAIDKLMMKPDDITSVPHWDQIAGNHPAKDALWNSIMDRKQLPWVFDKAGSLLLFGPPGTGKTTMVKAIARHAGFPCMEISGDFIRRKDFGQSEAVVGKIFAHARTIAPCLIFIDEVEEILGTKNESAISAEEGIKAQFLKQMSVLNDSGSPVWVVAATNKPWALGASLCQRFSAKIYVPLPEKNDALRLFKHHLKNLETRQTSSRMQAFTIEKGAVGQDLDLLIAECFRPGQKRHLSGHDFIRAVDRIPSMLYSEIKASPLFHKVVIDNQQCIIHVKDRAEKDAFRKPVAEFSDEELNMLKFRAIGIADARESLENIQGVSTEGSIQSFEDWNRDFGDGPKKKIKHPVRSSGNTQPSSRHGRGDPATKYDLTHYISNFR